MTLQKQFKNKIDEDYMNFKARVLNCRKVHIYNLSDKIQFAKLLKKYFSYMLDMYDDDDILTFMTMKNIFDDMYRLYEEEFESGNVLEIDFEDLLDCIL